MAKFNVGDEVAYCWSYTPMQYSKIKSITPKKRVITLSGEDEPKFSEQGVEISKARNCAILYTIGEAREIGLSKVAALAMAGGIISTKKQNKNCLIWSINCSVVVALALIMRISYLQDLRKFS